MIRGRFAPSPTGPLHLGNARTALLAWLHARHAGGRFVLRMEDIDRQRSSPAAARSILDDLRWLGLDWDEGPEPFAPGATAAGDVGPYGPYTQGERGREYRAALERLWQQGLVYRCYCSRADIARAASAPHEPNDEGPRYPGTCRNLTPAREAELRAGGAAALRFRVPPGPVRFDDLIAGPQSIDVAETAGDFVVCRADGTPAYQLAVVVDDARMRITHVLRGADLLASTARQLLLYRALGQASPAFAHVPLVLGPDGQRLAKRHGDIAVASLRERGWRPERVIGWLAALSGLVPPGTEAAAAELVPQFDLARIPREPIALEVP